MVGILLAPGFEEAEALVPADLLRRAGIDVILVGVNSLEITGSHQITVKADKLLNEINAGDLELLFLPGGLGGVAAVSVSIEATALIRAVAASGRYVAAICAGPTVLAGLGLLEGRRAVCFPGMEDQLVGAVVQNGSPVVMDGPFLTGEAAVSVFPFAFKLIELLRDPETAQQVCDSIHYHG